MRLRGDSLDGVFAEETEPVQRAHRPRPVQNGNCLRLDDHTLSAFLEARIVCVEVSLVGSGAFEQVSRNGDECILSVRDEDHRLMLREEIMARSPSLSSVGGKLQPADVSGIVVIVRNQRVGNQELSAGKWAMAGTG